MAQVAVMFPGQGAQTPGMGLELARAHPGTAGRVFEVADRALGFRLSRLVATGDARLLAQTEITQPALLAASLAAWRVLQAELPGFVPVAAAGLSLGEYSALVAAGALDLGDAFRLVSARSRFMADAARSRPGSMCAVLGLDRAKVEALCAEALASGSGDVQIANYNAPAQYVVTGDEPTVQEVADRTVAAGGRAVSLRTGGSFHSPHMTPARRRLAPLLRATRWQPPLFPVYANATARPHRNAGRIADRLAVQVTSSVLWEDIVRRMWARGVRIFVELGPGRSLSGLVSRIVPRAVTLNVSDLATLSRAVRALGDCVLGVVS